jgi:hypothetical protein
MVTSLFFTLAFALGLVLQTVDDTNIGHRLFPHVQGIEGRSPEGRLSYIKAQLDRLDVPYRTMPFDTTLARRGRSGSVKGENIVVRLGHGDRHVVVGAHADAVPNSPGANDNGAGVAVLLGLVEQLRNHPWNITVDFCFFDREEMGLVGSAVYVGRYADRQRHLAMINLDVVGTGEEVYVGPVGGGDDDFLMPILRGAAKKTGFPFSERTFYPPSDHRSFAEAALENISISVVPKGDADRVSAMLQGKGDPADPPLVLRVMHTPRDSSTHVSASALGMAYQFTKTALLLIDESLQHSRRN